MSEVNLSLDGKVALTTGGSKGICRSIALAFAEHGANLAIVARGHEALEATRRDIEATGRRCVALSADMSHEDEWRHRAFMQGTIDHERKAGLATRALPMEAANAPRERAAEAILALRAHDGSATPNLPYTLGPAPGVYQPTPNPEFPAVVTPSFAGWAHVTPFALRHNAQFEVEPGAIFDLTGAEYSRDYNEVKEVGDARVRGALPDSEKSDIARFWPGGGANWNLTTRVIVDGLGMDRWQHARLFALLNIAGADGMIAAMTWKYTYNFWRPVTAIRWEDDGNSDTASDPTWRPFLATPAYPDYPCNLPSNASASAEVLRQFFGTDDIAFSRTVDAGPVPLPAPMAPLPPKTITRSFDTLSEAVAESRDARVYSGIHFREGCVTGTRQGEQIGRFAVRHELRPLKGK